MVRSLRRTLVIALAVGGICAPAMAEVWDSGGADSNFTSALNWDTNLVPVNNGTANLFFGSGAKLTPNVNIPFDVNGITFTVGSPAFSLGGSTLTVRGGITNQSANLQSFTNPIIENASLQFWTAGSGNLQMSGPVTLAAASQLSVGGSFNTLFSGTLTVSPNWTASLAAPRAASCALAAARRSFSFASAVTGGPARGARGRGFPPSTPENN